MALTMQNIIFTYTSQNFADKAASFKDVLNLTQQILKGASINHVGQFLPPLLCGFFNILLRLRYMIIFLILLFKTVHSANVVVFKNVHQILVQLFWIVNLIFNRMHASCRRYYISLFCSAIYLVNSLSQYTCTHSQHVWTW